MPMPDITVAMQERVYVQALVSSQKHPDEVWARCQRSGALTATVELWSACWLALSLVDAGVDEPVRLRVVVLHAERLVRGEKDAWDIAQDLLRRVLARLPLCERN